jgi:proline racemase
VLERSLVLDVPGYGTVEVAVAYGGIFYAIASASSLGIRLEANDAAEIVQAGVAIRAAANQAFTTVHPENAKIRGIANVVIAGEIAEGAGGAKKTVSATVIGNGRLDRSPCGTGVAARMALLCADGLIQANEEVTNHSIFGTHFLSRVVSTTSVGPLKAVVSCVSGRAWITGFSQTMMDPSDPLQEGHCPSDVWLSRG